MLQPLRDAQVAFGALAEAHVQHQPHVRPDGFAVGDHLLLDGRELAIVDRAVQEAGRRPEAAAEEIGLGLVEEDRVGLHRAIALRHRFAGDVGEVLQRADGRMTQLRIEVLARTHAVAAAMRPVHGHAIAQGAAQQSVHGHAHRLARDVQAGVLDGRDGLLREAARGQPRRRDQRLADAAELARVHAHGGAREVLDQRVDARAGEAVVELGPADEALVRAQLEVGAAAVAAVRVEGLCLDDLHALFSFFFFPAPATSRGPFTSGRPASIAACSLRTAP